MGLVRRRKLHQLEAATREEEPDPEERDSEAGSSSRRPKAARHGFTGADALWASLTDDSWKWPGSTRRLQAFLTLEAVVGTPRSGPGDMTRARAVPDRSYAEAD